MARHLFFASTPFNMLTASMVAFSLPENDVKHLYLIDQPENQSNFIRAFYAWEGSPFSLVQKVSNKTRGLSKQKKRRSSFATIDQILGKLKPDRIYTGNDRRIEFQYAMAHSNNACGIYIDDGTYTYLGRHTNWFKDHLIDNFVKKITYGPWWKQPRTIGASAWISECIVAFPMRVSEPLKHKILNKLPLNFDQVEFNKLSQLCLTHYQGLSNKLSKLDKVLLLPHESVIDSNVLIKLKDWLQEQPGNLAIKHHPRTTTKTSYGLDDYYELPSELPIEVLLSLLQPDCKVAGDVSTALMTAKCLRPELQVEAFTGDATSPEWQQLLAEIDIITHNI